MPWPWRWALREPVTLQPQYSLIVREIEWEIVPAAQDAGLGLLPWSPLGGGWLSGKYRRDSGRPATPGSARTRTAGWRPTTGAAARPDLAGRRRATEVAEARGVSHGRGRPGLGHRPPGVTSTILGARTVEQLSANLGRRPAPDPEETAALDVASDLGASDYPYGELGEQQRSRLLG